MENPKYLIEFRFKGYLIAKLLITEDSLNSVKHHAAFYFKIVRSNKLNLRIERVDKLNVNSPQFKEVCKIPAA
jgi:hypothetical protein